MARKKENITDEQLTQIGSFLGIVLGIIFYSYDIVNAQWTIPVILILSFTFIWGLKRIVEKDSIDDEDFDLPGFGEPIWQSTDGIDINLSYTDASGKCTKRRLSLHKIYKDSKTRFYFQGYCHLRKAERTFISDRIKDLHHINGEVIEIPEFINNLSGYEAFGSKKIALNIKK